MSAVLKRSRKDFLCRDKNLWMDFPSMPIYRIEPEESWGTFARHCGSSRACLSSQARLWVTLRLDENRTAGADDIRRAADGSRLRFCYRAQTKWLTGQSSCRF